MLHRALLKTHHMTSRKKIQAIAKAAKSLSCAVVIKTGHPPGVMIAECECEDESPELDVMGKEENGKKRVAGEGGRRLSEWVSAVKVCDLISVVDIEFHSAVCYQNNFLFLSEPKTLSNRKSITLQKIQKNPFGFLPPNPPGRDSDTKISNSSPSNPSPAQTPTNPKAVSPSPQDASKS